MSFSSKGSGAFYCRLGHVKQLALTRKEQVKSLLPEMTALLQELPDDVATLTLRFAAVITSMRPDSRSSLEFFLMAHERGMGGQLEIVQSAQRSRNGNAECMFATRMREAV